MAESYEIRLDANVQGSGRLSAGTDAVEVSVAARLEVMAYSDDADGRLVKGEDRRYRIESVTLRPRVSVADPASSDKARRLLDKAEEVCLIGRSISAEVTLEPEVVVIGTAAR